MSRTYSRSGQPDLVVDLFDMGKPAHAFGVFSQSMEYVDTTYGQGSQISKGMIVFWKDRFYISMLAVPANDETQDAMEMLSEGIDDRIPQRGALPAIMNLLPHDSLVASSVRYFTHHIWQNSLFFISNENILDMGKNTEAVLGRYVFPDVAVHLLLIQYPREADATLAQEHFRAAYQPSLATPAPDAAVQPPPVHLRRADRLLMLAFGAADEKTVDTLFQKIEHRQQQGVRR